MLSLLQNLTSETSVTKSAFLLTTILMVSSVMSGLVCCDRTACGHIDVMLKLSGKTRRVGSGYQDLKY
jgi:hypothetical protein